MSIPFKDIAKHKRVKDDFVLRDVRHGELSADFRWMGISQMAAL